MPAGKVWFYVAESERIGSDDAVVQYKLVKTNLEEIVPVKPTKYSSSVLPLLLHPEKAS
jgi:hypothetical protein